MSSESPRAGRVVSLHIHPPQAGEPMLSMPELDLVAGQGILQNKRYFGRKSRNGEPTKRQITLIEREQIAEHAAILGLESIAAGLVRSNIETEGIDLVPLCGQTVRIGTAVLLIGHPRDPCRKMDLIAPGLKDLMDEGKQGMLAQVITSGKIRVGDKIVVLPSTPA
ncbi:MAG: MOSC domain-containing protein [Limisphaerales bacterium]